VALDFTFGTLTPPRTAILYSGERFDSDLQLYYQLARYYNPTIGRFGVQDQVDGTPQDPLSLHKYAYCQNNPVNGRDPSGNETLASMSFAMTIADIVETAMDVHLMWTAGKMLTEYATASESIDQIEGQPATPGVDTATIIVHGVNGLYNGQPNGWSKQNGFQGNLGPKPTLKVGGDPLNHDFYEFDWGGFSIASIGFIPVRIVHVMALVHLQAAEEIISMKGYANIDIISHSWGTTLSYDLMNSTDIEVHDWVTMGSPLKKTTEKPKCNTGKWINCYSLYDPATHFEIFPPYMDWIEMLPYAVEGIRSGRQGKIGDGLTVDPNVTVGVNHNHPMGLKDFDEHTAYWTRPEVLTDLRNDLQ
jgi:RHS repeat-associated protein